MADDTSQAQQNDQPAQQQPSFVAVDPQTLLRLEQQAIAEATRKAEIEQKDETVPGGRYLLPSGLYVNAEGERHKDQKSE